MSIFLALFLLPFVHAQADSAIAAQNHLTTSTALPFPTATLAPADADSYIKSNWALASTGIDIKPLDLAFVADPFSGGSGGGNSSGPVLQTAYPAGSYSHGTGGAQFYSQFGGGGPGYEAMLLSYEIAFDSDYNWVKGGKLPGIRGGPVLESCSGGREPAGNDCFSARLMWRAAGAGEVYLYIPSQPGICSQPGIICNSDYGNSVGRGTYHFTAGAWNKVSLYVQMNSPPSASNGVVTLFFNGVQAFTHTGLQLRNGPAVTAGGLYFSTFFGGSDSTWATPSLVHSYYRNFQMWAGGGGSATNSSSGTSSSPPTSATSTSN